MRERMVVVDDTSGQNYDYLRKMSWLNDGIFSSHNFIIIELPRQMV